MKIGFSGSREGMTEAQCMELTGLLQDYKDGGHQIEFAHGSCIGSDARAHEIALVYTRHIEIFPPENDALMAHLTGSVTHPPAPYLERNKAIAKWCDILIAAPKSIHSKIVSRGTWHTIRQARLWNKKVIILTP